LKRGVLDKNFLYSLLTWGKCTLVAYDIIVLANFSCLSPILVASGFNLPAASLSCADLCVDHADGAISIS
jgi:hypothetical protein